jgi:hypothetical protein
MESEAGVSKIQAKESNHKANESSVTGSESVPGSESKDPPLTPQGDDGGGRRKPSRSTGADLSLILAERNLPDAQRQCIEEWLQYKTERKETYTPVGFAKFLTMFANNIATYGEATVIGAVETSMANGWKGVVWDKCVLNSRPGTEKRDDEIEEYRWIPPPGYEDPTEGCEAMPPGG